jgi:hypothetical protein
MRARIVFVISLLVATLASATAYAGGGFYVGFGVGGGLVSGDTAIALKDPGADPDYNDGIGTDLRTLFSTEEGEGVQFDFRLGYNILGITAIECNVSAGGNNMGDWGKIEGQGGIFGLVKLFPAQFFPEVADRKWDAYIYGGAGVYFMAYQPQARPGKEMDTEGRGWYPSVAIKWGIGGEYYVTPFLSFGGDLGFTHGYHSTFVINNDDDKTTEAKETATSFAFQLTVTMTFHFSTGK